MRVYRRFASWVEVTRLVEVINGLMDSVRGLYADDPYFISGADLVAIGDAVDSINDVLALLAQTRFDYHAYLKSPEWKARRDERILAAGGRCQVCNSDRRLNCHHRTYERIGHESSEDLIVLCEGCHKIFHDNGRLARPPAGRPNLAIADGTRVRSG